MADRYKTGENAPESGKYKVDGYVHEDSEHEDTSIDMEEGNQFPPSPTTHKAVYWVKA
ncbi:YjzC family protein [Lederbergia citri]|uniref:YjzC family protein n=1 Tax=Lederbergia citri TaxID=2833580 RepID=A0A942YJ37_9BACI|nr:YjzC family protein [Lederbergia citri]MBS4197105.1 YjzC family protein [Lederbergia citri]